MTDQTRAAIRAMVTLAFPPTAFKVELTNGYGVATWEDPNGITLSDDPDDEAQEVIDARIAEIVEQRIGSLIARDYEFDRPLTGRFTMRFRLWVRDDA